MSEATNKDWPWGDLIKPAESCLSGEGAAAGFSLQDLQIDTVASSSKLTPSDGHSSTCQPLVTPIYMSSTYAVDNLDDFQELMKQGGYVYSRLGNPTCQAAEVVINDLEGGAGSLTFSSGMSAISTALTCLLKTGDHMIITNTVYSGTHKYVTNFLSKFGIEVTWVDVMDGVEGYKKNIRPNTKVLYAETPVNPLIGVIDMEGLVNLARSRDGLVTMVDSTYASPCVQQPIKFGVDVVMHSASKYLGGHTDIVAGTLTMRTPELWRSMLTARTNIGTVMSPHDASLLSRGMKTLSLRMDRHCSNAQCLAEFLEDHPRVESVYYPGLPSHPAHEIAKKQMKGFSGMIAFDIKGGMEPAKQFCKSLKLIPLAVSLGGTESLISHPAMMTHGAWVISPENRRKAGITDGYIRFSVGIENVEDIRKDLQQALDGIKE